MMLYDAGVHDALIFMIN